MTQSFELCAPPLLGRETDRTEPPDLLHVKQRTCFFFFFLDKLDLESIQNNWHFFPIALLFSVLQVVAIDGWRTSDTS